jgi:hypothetical protein
MVPTKAEPYSNLHTTIESANSTNCKECISRWHLSYHGWTFATDLVGIPIMDPKYTRERRQKRPEHIEGEAIVDFREAFNSNPTYKNAFHRRRGSYGTRVPERVLLIVRTMS